MATTDPSLQSSVSHDDSGLWMKMDFDQVSDDTEMTQGDLAMTSGEIPHGYGEAVPSVMNGEGEADVFVLPPHQQPTGGSSEAPDDVACDPSEAVENVADGVTEAEVNPEDLEHATAEHDDVEEQVDESEEHNDTTSLTEGWDTEQAQATTDIFTETCYDGPGDQKDDPTGRPEEQESNQGSEDIVIVTGETNATQENWSEDIRAERDKSPTPSLTEEEMTETDNGNNTSDVDFNPTQKEKTCGPPELCKCNGNKFDTTATEEPDVPESLAEVSSDNEEQVDTRPLNYNVTKEQWVWRESATSEIPLPNLPITRGSSVDHGTGILLLSYEREGQEQGGNRTIAMKLQQGEQLLQRLQVLKQMQDVQDVSERPPLSQQVVAETADQTAGDGEVARDALGIEGEDLAAGGGDLTDEEDEKEESTSNVDEVEEGEASQGTQEEGDDCENKELEQTAETSSPTMPVRPDHHKVPRTEAENCDDDQSDSGVSTDFSPMNTQEIPSNLVPIRSTHHQHSTAGTSTMREVHQAAQGKQCLQRARGVFNLADNPDVLEIPFKTGNLSETLPTEAGPGQSTYLQKMQREISQEIQRELVLVNQGKIPGDYSKGEIQQLKETKMLFESFQQDNSKGPTRHGKLLPAPFKDHLYPSVLERTRSLELLSLQSQPVCRTHSLRLYKSTARENERTSESLRSKCPAAGGPQDVAQPSPYPKQEKHPRLHRSMDSLNVEAPALDDENGDGTRQECPILPENPFFKLRPALALQPGLKKDIREAKEREEELRRQRCTLYGETRRKSMEDEASTPTLTVPDVRQQSKGKLDWIWPPPSEKDQMNSGQTQEAKVQKAGGQKAPLWQRWEAGMINGQSSKEKE